MDRLTIKLDGNYYIADDTKVQHDANGYFGEAVSKLAKFENMYDDLVSQQGKLTEEMEKLKAEGKANTVKFKQLMANRMNNNFIIKLFETYGL